MFHDVSKNRSAFETPGIIYPTTQLNMPEYSEYLAAPMWDWMTSGEGHKDKSVEIYYRVRKCTYNVTLWRVWLHIFAVENL
jgi:hypothetical protein